MAGPSPAAPLPSMLALIVSIGNLVISGVLLFGSVVMLILGDPARAASRRITAGG